MTNEATTTTTDTSGTPPPPGTGSGDGAPPPQPKGGTEASGTALGAAITPPSKEGDGAQGKPTTSATADISLSFPDGVVVDKALMDKFVPLAKEYGLKSEQAQKIADLYMEKVSEHQKSVTEAWEKQQKEWQAANRKDADIGGAKYDANVEVARTAIDKFGGDALRKEIDALGIGDNPVLLKAWYAVGKAMSPDKAGLTGQRPNIQQNDEEARNRKMYPSMYNPDGTRKQ